MKKYYVLTLLISLHFVCISQTKRETEHWLVDKLNACKCDVKSVETDTDGLPTMPSFYRNSVSYIHNGCLIIDYVFIAPGYSSMKSRKQDFLGYDTSKHFYQAPLGDISNFQPAVDLKTNTVFVTTFNRSVISNSGVKTNAMVFGLRLHCEPDLLNRINKAVAHLRTFYQKAEPF